MHGLVCLQLWRTDEMMWIDDEAMLTDLIGQSCSASSSLGAAALSLSVLSAIKVEESVLPPKFLLTASTLWLGHPQRSAFMGRIQARIPGLADQTTLLSSRDRLLGLLSVLCLHGYVYEPRRTRFYAAGSAILSIRRPWPCCETCSTTCPYPNAQCARSAQPLKASSTVCAELRRLGKS